VFTEIQDFTPQNQAGAKCTFCGQHARDMEDGRRARTFRTPTHIHMEGWIEVCERCIRELAVKIGMIPVAEAEELEAMHEHEAERAEKLLHDLEDCRASVRSLAAEVGRKEDDRAAELDRTYKRGYEEGKTETELALADA
jgi:hypothetical protein